MSPLKDDRGNPGNYGFSEQLHLNFFEPVRKSNERLGILNADMKPSNLMNYAALDLEKIRQQYDAAPYPKTPIEKSPKDDANLNSFFIHCVQTPYYLRNQRLLNTDDLTILDAGCGSGYKALMLAEANPGARIVGVDLSEPSVELARSRLTHHGFNNAEFHTLLIEDLPALGLTFDYINCDEVLYMVPDPLTALQAMRAVLKPHGIIRCNFHSLLQRQHCYRALELFKLMGLMEENPGEFEVEIVIATMKGLKDDVHIKQQLWNQHLENLRDQDELTEKVLMNFLIQGDRGFTVPEVFDILRQANLEWSSMVAWRHWELTDLFTDTENLPLPLAMGLLTASSEEKLRFFELLHPVHRLIDLWCGHPDAAISVKPVSEWQLSDWNAAKIHLHPVLKTDKVKQSLLTCIQDQKSFDFSHYLPLPAKTSVVLESHIAARLLPLWEKPQPFPALVDRWLQVSPCNPVTLEPVTRPQVMQNLAKVLAQLEVFLYVLVEQQ